ncbi:MAG: NUDIX hydrolase [Oxalicibacterium faecigallinarum]|uniref:NUDIX hydrolase n=1 Tax=Oxalicibacterium faecigallinarum TaxID=573741 RepID=UPI002806C1B0|nr:NUDIX hydrolase [Oxalicibacterium faecigallinarum]MDQ7970225.1 NUDIX hydrolase [Oxalicibacterium faecigallinarum]
MISFDIANHRFQLRAAAVFVHNAHVLLHRIEGHDFWALPGGRVEPGEEARTTVLREMKEELNESIECDKLLYLVESFFEDAGKQNHEIGLYFLTRFVSDSPMLDVKKMHRGVEGEKKLEFRWFPQHELSDIALYPSFLCQALSASELRFQHVIQRG